MNVKLTSRETIKPSKPTPPHLRILQLSMLDQISLTVCTPLIIFYANKETNILDTPKTMSNLKKSLSETLIRFYPLAGRVRDLAHVDCNDEGVLYIEAKTNIRVSEFLENPKPNMLGKFMPNDTKSFDSETEAIMVAIQVTSFECGGITIAMTMLHRIMDAMTISVFLDNWSKTARGCDNIDKSDIDLDWFTASHLFPPLDSFPKPLVTFFNGQVVTERPKFGLQRFVFSSEKIASLKAKTRCEAVPNPTRIEVLTSFVCSRLITASKTLNPSDMSLISHFVNIRRRIVPPLPKETLRNFIWIALTMFPSSDSDAELHELVELVNEMLVNLNDDMIKSFQGENGKEMLEGIGKYLVDSIGSDQKINWIRFVSWCNMGFYEFDFGWGKPVYVTQAADVDDPRSNNGVLFVESNNGDGIEMGIMDNEEILSFLENDSEFLTYASINPPIIKY